MRGEGEEVRIAGDERDRGVLMILDDRLLTKSYGKTVLASLPPFSKTRRAEDACAFLVSMRESGADPGAPVTAAS